jgi:hypothetical protein
MMNRFILVTVIRISLETQLSAIELRSQPVIRTGKDGSTTSAFRLMWWKALANPFAHKRDHTLREPKARMWQNLSSIVSSLNHHTGAKYGGRQAKKE